MNTSHSSVDTSKLDVSVVVIGRNEGERLVRCLQSIRDADWNGLRHEVIYVDSNSTDLSVRNATAFGAKVLTIGDRRLCAASARNVGWRAATGCLVLFLDGDTVLDPHFVPRAYVHFLVPHTAAVWGHRRELRPQQSIYTEVLDLDWVYPLGDSDYFGGDALVRRAALEQADGFDETLVAGEEPELGWHLRDLGWRIRHVDLPMTRHDLAIQDGSAYWRRAVRTGLAFAQVANRFKDSSDPLWSREVSRNEWHVLAMALWLVSTLLAAVVAPSVALSLLALAATLLFRSAHRCLWKCPGNWLLAFKYAAHVHFQHIPIWLGQRHWQRLLRARMQPELMEYK